MVYANRVIQILMIIQKKLVIHHLHSYKQQIVRDGIVIVHMDILDYVVIDDMKNVQLLILKLIIITFVIMVDNVLMD
jgi:hypothetical protein